MDKEEITKNLAKNMAKIFANNFAAGKVKFYKGSVEDDPMFNVNILKELNLEQLKYLGDILMEEIKERLKKQ